MKTTSLIPACAAALLFFTSCASENEVTPATVDKNFNIPCLGLAIGESRWNFDLNILTIELDAAPSDSFYTALTARGWVRHEDANGTFYLFDDGKVTSRLSYYAEEGLLLMSSELNTAAGGNSPQPTAP